VLGSDTGEEALPLSPLLATPGSVDVSGAVVEPSTCAGPVLESPVLSSVVWGGDAGVLGVGEEVVPPAVLLPLEGPVLAASPVEVESWPPDPDAMVGSVEIGELVPPRLTVWTWMAMGAAASSAALRWIDVPSGTVGPPLPTP
jgi:hypothetical protein